MPKYFLKYPQNGQQICVNFCFLLLTKKKIIIFRVIFKKNKIPKEGLPVCLMEQKGYHPNAPVSLTNWREKHNLICLGSAVGAHVENTVRYINRNTRNRLPYQSPTCILSTPPLRVHRRHFWTVHLKMAILKTSRKTEISGQGFLLAHDNVTKPEKNW